MRGLDATPHLQNQIKILRLLPWSLKLVYGFISDTFPLCGMKRKPYLLIGALLNTGAFLLYSVSATNHFILLAICVFVSKIGIIMMDVMADTMIVERSQYEPESDQGRLLASSRMIRAAGNLLGEICGTYLYNKTDWGWGLTFHQITCILALVPLILIAPWIRTLRERYEKEPVELCTIDQSSDEVEDVSNSVVKTSYQAHLVEEGYLNEVDDELIHSYSGDPLHVLSVKDQLLQIWHTAQLASVWRPMIFVFCFKLLQVPNVAWSSFLQLSLGFDAFVLGLMDTLGSITLVLGIALYQRYLMNCSFRSVFIGTSAVSAFFSMLQLLLVFQVNVKYLHMSNYLFSIGDDVISQLMLGLQTLPINMMYIRLCPKGTEGSTYAMLTMFDNVAGLSANSLGDLIGRIWDVSNDAMRALDVGGLWKLTLVTSCLSILPIALVYLLPVNVKYQKEEVDGNNQRRSKVAGFLFLSVLIGSVLWNAASGIGAMF